MIFSFKNYFSSFLLAALFSACLCFASYSDAAVCGPPLWNYTYTGELTKLSGPSKIEVDYSGKIYVADYRGNAIRIFNFKGEAINVVPVQYPRGVAVNQSGQIYVAQTKFVSVLTLDEKGKIANSRSLGAGKLSFANDVAVDQVTGRVFIVDSIFKRVYVYGSDDAFITDFAQDPYSSKDWIAIDIDQENGLVYLTAQGNSRIEAYSLDNYNYVKAIGKADNPFVMLQGISADPSGRFFVVDGGVDTIYFFDGCSTYLSPLGRHGYGPGEFNMPLDVAADSYGRIYVPNIDGRISIFRSAEMVAPEPSSPINSELLKDNNFSLVVTNGTIKPYEEVIFAANLTYEFQIAIDEKFANIVVRSPLVNENQSGSTSWDVSGQVSSGYYFWRARVFDGTAYGPWSMTASFKVELPNAPPIIDPDTVVPVDKTVSMYVGDSLTFSVTAHDPENDVLTYTWLLDGAESVHTQTFNYLPLTSDIGTHTVVVRVSDGLNEIDWPWNVTIHRRDTAPVAPSAYKPIGGEDVATLTPQLAVNNSYDVESDKLSYTFEVSETVDFANISDMVTVPEGINITVAVVGSNGALKDNRLYYWRTRSCELEFENICSPYSDVESFFVNTVNDAPSIPGIKSPSDGIEVTTVMPSFSVTKSSDIDLNDSLTYEFEIAADSSYLTIVKKAEGLVPEPENDFVLWPGADTAWEGDPLDDNRTYYWRARAIDNHGFDSGWMKASFFVNTANDEPAKPVLLSPAPETEVASKTVTLVTNNSSDPDMDSLVYLFELDKANNFASQDLKTSSLIAEGVDVTSWLIPEELLENTVYYWRVKVRDGSTEILSDTASFFVNTIDEAPYTPLLNMPLAGSKVLTDTPLLSAHPSSDPDRDRVRYIYQVSDNADFAYIVDQSPLMDAEWEVSIPLNENMKYYWRAAAQDEDDMTSQWSEPWSFIINVTNEAPSAPVISSHMFGISDSIVLEIANSNDPEGDILTYNVEIYSDRNLTAEVETTADIPEGDGVTYWTPTLVLNNGVYYWRARAHDGQIYGSWSGTRELHIDKARKNSDPRTDKAYGRKRF